MFGRIHPTLVKPYCYYFIPLQSSNQKCILFLLQSQDGMHLSFLSLLPSVSSEMAEANSPLSHHTGPFAQACSKALCVSRRKSTFCASCAACSVLLYHVPGLMHGPSFLQINFGELREAANFTSLGSLMVTVDKTSSSKWYLQMAVPNSNFSLTLSI